MLCRNVIVTLLVASISTLRVGASEDGDQTALPNKPLTPIDISGTVLEALTVQKDNVYKTGPNDQSIYGSIAQEKTEVYESPDSSQPSSTRTRTAFAPGGPGKQGVSYARSEEPQYQEQPNQNQNSGDSGRISYGSYTYQKGNTYLTGPNDNSIYGSVTVHKNNQGNVPTGSITVQTGNTYETDPGSKISFGSVTYQEGNRYGSLPNQQTSNNSSNSTEGQVDSQKLNKRNGQTKLSPNKFCLFFLTWIGLSKYCRS